jgi:hypothetical protein
MDKEILFSCKKRNEVLPCQLLPRMCNSKTLNSGREASHESPQALIEFLRNIQNRQTYKKENRVVFGRRAGDQREGGAAANGYRASLGE